MTKKCSKCLEIKQSIDFYWREKHKNRRASHCKVCISLRDRTGPNEWSKKNVKRANEIKDEWARKNPKKVREARSRFDLLNPDKVANINRQRRLRYSVQTPSWITPEQRNEMKSFYTQAQQLGLTVDHIIPLNGVNVKGLHVPWNLQLLSLEENSRKGNKYEY